MDLLLTHGVNLLRLEAGIGREVIALLEGLQKELIGKLTNRELTSIGRQRLLDLLAETKSLIASVYIEMRKAVDMAGLAQLEIEHTERALKLVVADKLAVGTPSAASLKALVGDVLIQGAPSFEWWARQASDTAFRFANAVRQGIAQGETNAQIVARVRGKAGAPGVIEISRRNAEALVRSSVQAVANDARLAMFQANADLLAGMQQISTLDGRTTDICIAYSGASWDLEGEPIDGTRLPFNGGPPRHWNCRSILTPLTKNIPGLFDFKPSTRASEQGEINAKSTFADWLATKSAAFQDELLGTGRAQLLRDGTITLHQLLDQRGRPLTLEQLRQKYAD